MAAPLPDFEWGDSSILVSLDGEPYFQGYNISCCDRTVCELFYIFNCGY
jgi:hypothetical protein